MNNMQRVRIFIIALLVTAGFYSCRKEGGMGVPSPGTLPEIADTSLAALMPFPFGAAVSVNLLKTNTAYRHLVAHEYSSLTGENAMKFRTLHPSEDVYDWDDADYLVDFAEENGQRVHGHTLIWYNSLPSWVTTFSGDSLAWENLMKDHIQTVVGHYRGRVASWDVVNEAFNDDGSLRNSVWREHLGDDYIARAFQYAHEADTNALLFYNDFGNEYGPTRRNAVLHLANDLVSRGIPIHGIGMQMHTRYNREDLNIEKAITTAAETGLMVHISEIEISMNPANDPLLVYSDSIGEVQADKYRFIVSTYNSIPAAQKFGITTWNVSDADSWIPDFYSRPDWPLPFDTLYQRKQAYYAIIEGAY